MSLLKIPQMYLKDKQAFKKVDGMLKLVGKPLDAAKAFKADGFRLIHIIDMDAAAGLPRNMDVYDGLTYIINVQVECAPLLPIVMKLLSLKCRVVLPPSMDVTSLKEKKLLVAQIPEGYIGEATGFHDVLIQRADDESVRRLHAIGKRIIVYSDCYRTLSPGVQKLVWGVISSS